MSFCPAFQKKSEETQLLGMLLGSGKSNKRCENIGIKKSKTIVVIAKAYFYFLFLSSAKLAEVLSQIFHVGTELMRMKLI